MVLDAKRAGKGVDFYGMNEKFALTPSGIVVKIHQKMGLACSSSSQNLDL